jgi:hypothetical protein
LRYQLSAPRILCLGCSGEKLDQISRLCRNLGPTRRWSRNGMALEFFVAASQDRLIGLDLVEAPADFRRSLCGHAAMLVEFNWVVRHHHSPSPPSYSDILGLMKPQFNSWSCQINN